MTDDAPHANAAQAAFWTDGPGRIWAAEYRRLDALMAPVTAELLARARIAPGERVLDVGCGAGDTALAAADRVGPGGQVTGLDISETLLDVARQRAAGRPNVAFLGADAQTHRFAPGALDLILSRHGVMFFADPAATFRNLATALRPGGRIHFAAWAAAALNPWVSEARAEAEARLGSVPPDPPRTPGPFAFAECGHVTDILAGAGFADIVAGEAETALEVAGRAEDAAALAATIGPVSYVMRLKGGGEADRAAIIEGLIRRFRRFEAPDGVRLPAVMNFFSAHRR